MESVYEVKGLSVDRLLHLYRDVGKAFEQKSEIKAYTSLFMENHEVIRRMFIPVELEGLKDRVVYLNKKIASLENQIEGFYCSYFDPILEKIEAFNQEKEAIFLDMKDLQQEQAGNKGLYIPYDVFHKIRLYKDSRILTLLDLYLIHMEDLSIAKPSIVITEEQQVLIREIIDFAKARKTSPSSQGPKFSTPVIMQPRRSGWRLLASVKKNLYEKIFSKLEW